MKKTNGKNGDGEMKKRTERTRKVLSLAQIYLMISMSIAFSILLGWQMPVVSAAGQIITSEGYSYRFNNGQWEVVGNGNGYDSSDWSGASVPDYLAQTKIDVLAGLGESAGKTYLQRTNVNIPMRSQPTVLPAPTNFVPAAPAPTPAPTATKPTVEPKYLTGETLNKAGTEYYKKQGLATPIYQDGLVVDKNKDGTFTYDGNKYKLNGGEWQWLGTTADLDYTGHLFGMPVNGQFMGHLADGVTWGGSVATGIIGIGKLLGVEDNILTPLAAAAGVGLFAGQATIGAIKQFGGEGLKKNAAMIGAGVGIAAAVLTFLLMYKKISQKVVKFECLPWEAPLGGAKCEECNKDPFRPCSEYRCKAIGQACSLLNAGSKQEMCAWVGRNDVKSPVITLWDGALSPSGLKYAADTAVRPPMLGFKIQKDSKCLPAFTSLQFGIKTDEPAQCKIDMNHTAAFDDMQYFFGGSNFYEYNHTEKFNLPGPEQLQNVSAPILRNDGSFAYYIRCQDANGNYNRDEFVVSFCVDKGPDTTPPVIQSFSINSGSAVQYKVDNISLEAYTNEPAQCKWSTANKAYKDMENSMVCSGRITQLNSDLLYTCVGKISGIKDRADNQYYFKCKDPAGNEMVQSKELLLRGSQPLTIIDVQPNGTISGSTSTVATDLIVKTENGADEGKAQCMFSTTGVRDSYIAMFETDSYSHKQSLSLTSGDYNYFFRCIDSGGNFAENRTSFTIKVDKSAPIIARIYKQEGLKIVTDEDAECSYSLKDCNFKFEEGTAMIYSNLDKKTNLYAEWKPSQVYYVKCKDKYDNQPGPNECSAVVSAVTLSGETTNSFGSFF